MSSPSYPINWIWYSASALMNDGEVSQLPEESTRSVVLVVIGTVVQFPLVGSRDRNALCDFVVNVVYLSVYLLDVS